MQLNQEGLPVRQVVRLRSPPFRYCRGSDKYAFSRPAYLTLGLGAGYFDFRKLNLDILKIVRQCVPRRDDLGD